MDRRRRPAHRRTYRHRHTAADGGYHVEMRGLVEMRAAEAYTDATAAGDEELAEVARRSAATF